MNLTSVQEVREAPSNLTNEELVSHIRHQFPNLRGPLRMMSDRFAHNASAIDNGFEPAEPE